MYSKNLISLVKSLIRSIPVPEKDPVLRGAGEEEVVVEGVPGNLVHRGHVGSEGAEKLGGELHRAQLNITLLKITY